jgi:hypothetical protein
MKIIPENKGSGVDCIIVLIVNLEMTFIFTVLFDFNVLAYSLKI